MLIKKKSKKLRSLAVSEIIILILGTIAVAYIIGGEIEMVSAAKLSFEFIPRGQRNLIPVEYSTSYTPAITTGLPSGDFSFFTNPVYTGTGTPGAGFVATDGSSVYFFEKGIWNPYRSETMVNILDFIPDVTPSGFIPSSSQLATTLPYSSVPIPTQPLMPGYTEWVAGPQPSGFIPPSSEPATALPYSSGGGAPEVVTPTTEAAREGFLKGLDLSWKNLAKNAVGAAVAWAITRYLLPEIFSKVSQEAWNQASWFSAGGYFFGSTLGPALFPEFASGLTSLLGISSAAIPLGIIFAGAGIGFYFLFIYKKEYQETFIFNCYPWRPEPKGQYCDECGKGILPCSKYECESLGQGCELLNEGTGDEICFWVNRNDFEPPTIEPWEEALQESYSYEPDNKISPPDTGVIVNNTATSDGCVPPYGIVSFGVELNKPAACKWSTTREDSFEDMGETYFSNKHDRYNHSIQTSLPGVEALEAEDIRIENEGWNNVYVRCKTSNDASNTANFVFRFCMSQAPDTMAPEIRITSPLNGMPIAFNQASIDIDVYLNEPADCKWSHEDKDYGNMEGTFDTCAQTASEMNAQMLYKCSGTLDGLINNIENKFYFRCKDKPNAAEEDRNVMEQSYLYSLIGTRPLVIDWVKPDSGSIVKGASDSIKVTLEARTSAGYEQGKAVCEYNQKCYNENGDAQRYVQFGYPSGTDLFSQYQHSQDLWLNAGTYECSIKCTDLGGNTDTKITIYTIETDTDEPIVVRAYHDESYLKIITNEPSTCRYDTKYENSPCDYNFEDGIKMTDSSDKLSHTTGWNTRTNFYIKCKDDYGNEPYNYCSIIVRPSVI